MVHNNTLPSSAQGDSQVGLKSLGHFETNPQLAFHTNVIAVHNLSLALCAAPNNHLKKHPAFIHHTRLASYFPYCLSERSHHKTKSFFLQWLTAIIKFWSENHHSNTLPSRNPYTKSVTSSLAYHLELLDARALYPHNSKNTPVTSAKLIWQCSAILVAKLKQN